MHTHMLWAALAAFAVLLPVRSEAQASGPTEHPRAQSAQGVVGQLLSHRQELSLTSGQVDSLTMLATRIREDQGRLQIAGFDIVPGKSVPRFARVYRIRREAKGMALRLLTPDQRIQAEKVFHSKPLKTAAR